MTKTEYIYQSASEDEPEEISKEPEKRKEAIKPQKSIEKTSSISPENDTGTQKGKDKKTKKNMQNQPTLMNFFKKK